LESIYFIAAFLSERIEVMTCCQSAGSVDSSSSCQCSPCKYPNGLIPLIVAQVLIVIALPLSVYAVWDCQFVTIDTWKVANILDAIEIIATKETYVTAPNDISTTRGLGFYIWEGIDGECAPKDSYDDTDLWYDLYHNFLGSDWNAPRSMATLSAVVSFLLMIWLFIFSCVAQPKILRYSLVTILILLMPIFQSIPFMVLQSDLCNEYDCNIGSSARCGIAAVVVYVLTGLALLFTKSYPSPALDTHQSNAVTIAHDNQNPGDHVYPQKEQEPNQDPLETTHDDVTLVEEKSEPGAAITEKV
jgi:hypothetical protein